jgi:membrane associated rhomboid family serine protease
MAAPDPPPALSAGLFSGTTDIWLVAGLLTLPEAVLLGADQGFWGSAAWRSLVYSWGAFWPGLLHGWQPNFALQPLTMFLTCGALHAGPGHLLGNLGALAWLGTAVQHQFGRTGFWLIWAAGWLGGGAGFGLLSRQATPMVGASGALFGLAAAWLVWGMRDARAAGLPRARIAARATVAAAGLALLNLASWWLQDGHLAWQAHLGGMLAGAALATALPRRG